MLIGELSSVDTRVLTLLAPNILPETVASLCDQLSRLHQALDLDSFRPAEADATDPVYDVANIVDKLYFRPPWITTLSIRQSIEQDCLVNDLWFDQSCSKVKSKKIFQKGLFVFFFMLLHIFVSDLLLSLRRASLLRLGHLFLEEVFNDSPHFSSLVSGYCFMTFLICGLIVLCDCWLLFFGIDT